MQVKMPMIRKELHTGTMDWDSAVRICRARKMKNAASLEQPNSRERGRILGV